MTSPLARPARHLAVMLLMTGLLAGCAIPADPDQTLERIVSSGELRVGISVHPPFTIHPAEPGAPPTGTEAELLHDFARSLGAEPVWTIAGEEALVTMLEEGELDVVAGGLTKKSPWGRTVALTRPCSTTTRDGKKVRHVMAAVPGENALLVELERHLDGARP